MDMSTNLSQNLSISLTNLEQLYYDEPTSSIEIITPFIINSKKMLKIYLLYKFREFNRTMFNITQLNLQRETLKDSIKLATFMNIENANKNQATNEVLNTVKFIKVFLTSNLTQQNPFVNYQIC